MWKKNPQVPFLLKWRHIKFCRNDFFKLTILPKNKRTINFTTVITQVDLFLFVFWKKSKTPKKLFEINWPLWISSNPYIFMIWDHLLQKQEKRDLYIMALKYWMQPKCHLTKKFHITLSIFPSTTFMINRLHFNLIERVL